MEQSNDNLDAGVPAIAGAPKAIEEKSLSKSDRVLNNSAVSNQSQVLGNTPSANSTSSINEIAQKILELNQTQRVFQKGSDVEQLKKLVSTGFIETTIDGESKQKIPSLPLLKSLFNIISNGSNIEVMSWIRPQNKVKPNEKKKGLIHAIGYAIDIQKINGVAIKTATATNEELIEQVNFALKNLSSGKFVIGLPRYSDDSKNIFLSNTYNERFPNGATNINKTVELLINPVAKSTLKKTIDDLRSKNISVIELMADGLDHLHIQDFYV